MSSVKFLALSSVLVLLLAGCGSGYQIAPVSGKVTLSGKPLAGAAVVFQPLGGSGAKEPGPGSYGRTDADGRFVLRMSEGDRPGAVVGNHSVTISTGKSNPSSDSLRITGELAPAAFRDGSQRFEVPSGGTDQANFDLSRRTGRS